MAIVNPVPVFDFNVFFIPAKPSPATLGQAAVALGSLAIAAAQAVLFGSFREVSGLNAELEIETYQEGGRNFGPRRFVKWGRYPNLVFKRGVTFNTDLWDWHYQVVHGSKAPIRKHGVVILSDRGGVVSGGTGSPIPIPVLDRTPAAVWFFSNALPEKLQGPALNATGNEIAIETLEVSHEWLARVGPAMIPGVGETLAGLGI